MSLLALYRHSWPQVGQGQNAALGLQQEPIPLRVRDHLAICPADVAHGAELLLSDGAPIQ
eukprot:8378386-Prorocentrum_lima.AAC.1